MRTRRRNHMGGTITGSNCTHKKRNLMRFTILFLLFLNVYTAMGQAVISGTLEDRHGQPIDNVSVSYKKLDRKSTRLNSSHVKISYAVFCLKKKNDDNNTT